MVRRISEAVGRAGGGGSEVVGRAEFGYLCGFFNYMLISLSKIEITILSGMMVKDLTEQL